MNRNPKSQRRRVKALTDPHPEFVSLVQAGANMTPFKTVKSEDAQKADTHAIVKIAFNGKVFADETAVKEWLDEGGYEDYAITKTEEGFEVASVGSEGVDEAELSVIEKDDMTIFVMKLDEPTGEAVEKQPTEVTAVDGDVSAKTDEEVTEETTEATAEVAAEEAVKDEAEAEEAAKADEAEEPVAPEMRAKFDDMMAMYSNKDNLAGVLADGFDGVPPGFFEVTSAMYTAMRNACMGGDLEGIRRIANDYGTMVANMAAMFPMNDDMTMAQRSELFDALAPEIGLVQKEAAAEAEATEVLTEEAVSEEPVQPVAKEEAEDEATEAASVESEEAAETVEKTDTTQTDALSILVDAVGQLTAQVGSLHNDLTTKADALAERVEALEGRQTRKSADVEEVIADSSKMSTQKQEQSRAFRDLALRGALGISRRS
jgi:hypothetical protein